jgi:hypothetical protein
MCIECFRTALMANPQEDLEPWGADVPCCFKWFCAAQYRTKKPSALVVARAVQTRRQLGLAEIVQSTCELAERWPRLLCEVRDVENKEDKEALKLAKQYVKDKKTDATAKGNHNVNKKSKGRPRTAMKASNKWISFKASKIFNEMEHVAAKAVAALAVEQIN